jgi:FKBP-type peptidyl-prolyl cis-trans isomerase
MQIIKKYVFHSLLLLFLLLFFSCREETKPIDSIQDQNIEEKLVKANKKLVRSEEEKISDYVKRYNWEMSETGTGLRYMIYQHGTGLKAEKGKTATINYSVNLLNGDLCYTSDNSGPKEFVIGSGGVESGLEEGILLLKKGDRAKFIIPSHLAFGLVGDLDKIPAKATLIYDIELVEIK